MRTTPLYRDTLAFAAVLLELMEEVEGFAALRGRLTLGALAVVDAVAQALAGHYRLDRLADADAELCALRARLALAHYLGLVDDEGFTGLVAAADVIGRQLGGWQRRLARQGDAEARA